MADHDGTFRLLESLNVKIDIWIDDEDYKHINEAIKFIDSEVEKQIIKIFPDDNKSNGIIITEESELNKLFRELFLKLENHEKPSKFIKIPYGQNEDNSNLLEGNDLWIPLFFAKYLRAKIQENGTDDYTKHLDKLVTYLQRKLPYQSPENDQEVILQHIYYQELSACGKPGLESLGFAVQAHDLIAKKEDTGNASRVRFELYKLWAR